MANQEVTFSNFYESTLADILASGSNTMTLTAAPTTNGTSNIGVPYYLVIDPDEPAKREVVLVTAASGTSISGMTRDVEGRHGTAGVAATAPTHVGGTVVRMAVVKEMFEDLHDRVDASLGAATTAVFTNKTFDAEATGNVLSNVDVANLKSGVLDTDLATVSGSDDTLASAKAIKAALDSKASIGIVLALGG